MAQSDINKINLSVGADMSFVEDIRTIVRSARGKAYAAINYAQVEQNWLIGQRIVEQEQHGAERAEYGKEIIRQLSEVLTAEFGKGFSERNLRGFRRFFLEYSDLQIWQTVSAKLQSKSNQPLTAGSQILQTVSAKSPAQIGQTLSALLPWSHYERLMRIENKEARKWYEQEAYEQMWSYRTLDRNISTNYYERMLLSQVKEPVEKEMQEKTAAFQADKLEFIKNPTVLEFLALSNNLSYQEKELEQAILNNIQSFLLEMGKGFAFVGRQQLIRTDMGDFYIDLVFYNYILQCFVLVDLKVGRISHQDVGQMDMYVRMYDQLRRGENHNPTIGIVLCSETSQDIARYSILKGNEQLFATKYQLVLPKPEELQEEIQRQAEIIKTQLLEEK